MNRRSFLKFFGLGLAGTLATRAANARVCERTGGLIDRIYPVGSIYISTSSTNPATLLGAGTWQRFGNGRALVGVDEGNSHFNTVQRTGGAETHTLTTAQMPRHTHVQNPHTHTDTGNSGPNSADTTTIRRTSNTSRHGFNIAAATAINQFTGGTGTAQSASNGAGHNNLQPYITVFIWRRTA